MTIGKKLMISVGAMVLMLLAMAGSSLYSIATLGSDLDKTGTETAKKVDLAGQVAADTNMLRAAIRGIVVYTMMDDRAITQQNIEIFDTRVASMTQTIRDIKPLLHSQAGREDAAALEAGLPKVASIERQIAELCAAGKSKEAAIVLREQAVPATNALEKAANDLKVIQRETLKASVEEGARKASQAQWIAWVLVLVSVLVAAIIFKIILSMNTQLRRSASEIGEGAEQITSAAGQVASSSQSLAQGASEQAASLEETSASTEEITSMTRKNAENSQTAADVMTAVDQHVKEGNRTLEQMVVSMSEINASSDKISKIIKVIDEIAFQTNILALNAAVEAARAGEAGMGFAVVADEVRNLAQRSAQAAKDTSALIEESIAKSNEGSTKLQQVTEVIRAITDSASKVKTLVDEVNLGSQEQSRGIDQIGKAIQQMDQVTQSTAANAEESASASEELSAQAEAMNQVVQQLRVMVGGDGQESGVNARPAPVHSTAPAARRSLQALKAAVSRRATPVGAAVSPGKTGHGSFPLEGNFTEM